MAEPQALGKRPVAHKDLDDIEHWYSSLKDTTFPSKFLLMTLEEARAVCDGYTWTKALRADPAAKLAADVQSVLDKARLFLSATYFLGLGAQFRFG